MHTSPIYSWIFSCEGTMLRAAATIFVLNEYVSLTLRLALREEKASVPHRCSSAEPVLNTHTAGLLVT